MPVLGPMSILGSMLVLDPISILVLCQFGSYVHIGSLSIFSPMPIWGPMFILFQTTILGPMSIFVSMTILDYIHIGSYTNFGPCANFYSCINFLF